MAEFARVCINISQLTDTYDYAIPDELTGKISRGSLVVVPVGQQTAQGIVVQLMDEPAVMETKNIEALLDPDPVITPGQMQLAEWLAEENLEPISACMDLMLPTEISQHVDSLVELVPGAPIPETLNKTQKQITDLLRERGSLRGNQLDRAFPHIDWHPSVRGLVKQGVVTSRSFLPAISIRPKVIRTATLAVPPAELENRLADQKQTPAFPRRRRILDLLAREALPLNVSWVYAETGANLADLNWLAERDLVTLGETEIWRDPLANLPSVRVSAPRLTADQQQTWQIILEQIHSGENKTPNLLVGVTGSGKTEIYLRAVEETLALGRQAIIFVPEISLTPQTVRRFYARFPGKVGLIHSRLSPGERYDTWRRIRKGDLPVIVGARSAFFAPLPDIGLIVMDECHDGSYQQNDIHPYYNAVDAAIQYAAINNAVLILGSATPDVNLQYQAAQKKWNLVRLPNRIFAHRSLAESAELPGQDETTLPLPPVTVVDMRQELQAGNRSPLSRVLNESLAEVLQKNQQAILFLNRRGSASYVFCRDCGEVVRCPRCETPLTFHANETLLVCHHCNYQREMPRKCPVCGGPNIRQFGLGTESLEQMVREQFPEANVLRWDAETSRVKGAHDLILEHFIHHRADILIGTQMLAKGLDIPQVTLVGAILADVGLFLPDFRAAEKTFQVLTQVAGRAGRGPLGGKVILQTFHPGHYAIRAAAAHDLTGFSEEELRLRRSTGYPPFTRLVKVEFHSTDEAVARAAAEESAGLFQSWIDSEGFSSTSLIGPVPCFYSRLNRVYRWQIILRGPDPRRLFSDHNAVAWHPRGVNVEIIVDPASLL